jgi:hypothetical protein
MFFACITNEINLRNVGAKTNKFVDMILGVKRRPMAGKDVSLVNSVAMMAEWVDVKKLVSLNPTI